MQSLLVLAVALVVPGSAMSRKGSLSFLAIGDWGGKSDSVPTTPGEVENAAGMSRVARTLGNNQFILALGDNIYPDGIIGPDAGPRFKETFEDVFTQPEMQVPWYAIAGNHDHRGNVSAQMAYAEQSKRWVFPHYWYSFTKTFRSGWRTVTSEFIYTDAIVLAGMVYEDPVNGGYTAPSGPADEALAESQLAWLEEKLKNSKADYLWVAGHYPVYSICSHGPTASLVSRVLPLLKKYKVSGYISGHDHCLEHFIEDDIAYVVSGAGKECCYRPSKMEAVPSHLLKFHMDRDQTYGASGGFASVTSTEHESIITYYNTHGEKLYQAPPVYPRRVH
eukprot:Sspe_Gene.66758::Locus_39436_Transcript_1_2_Confidence_0.667_Length_1232::g.66758::m.66758/K14379/ACP5; tartrate-resistant acid phosphatase type 5